MICLHAGTGLLLMGVNALLQDGTFMIASQPAAGAYKIAKLLSGWIPNNQERVVEFEASFTNCLDVCFATLKAPVKKIQREKVWTTYHSVRTSKAYQMLWGTLLSDIRLNYSPIFCQYVGNIMFRKLLVKNCPTETSKGVTKDPKPLTLEEISGLRYAAGFIVRLVRRKLKTSKHPSKNDMLLCLFDLIDEGSDEDSTHESNMWVNSLNRGGLTLVSNTTYELFLAMEQELRRHVSKFHSTDIDHVSHKILNNDDVQFLWCILSCDWDESSASALIVMIVHEWIKIRGFSLASAWMEELKVAQRQTTQKSKGLRKQLVPVQKNI